MLESLAHMRYLLFITFCFSGLLTGFSQDDDGWKLAKDKNGIQVYTRTADESEIKEFKARTIVRTEIRTLENVIDDVEGYPRWQSNTKEAQILETQSQTSKIIHVGTRVPWPIKDRDLVLHQVKTGGGSDEVKFDLTSEPEAHEEQKGYVRIVNSEGHWYLRKLSGAETEVEYAFYADPEGNIPNWIVNLFIVDGPFDTLSNLKELVE